MGKRDKAWADERYLKKIKAKVAEAKQEAKAQTKQAAKVEEKKEMSESNPYSYSMFSMFGVDRAPPQPKKPLDLGVSWDAIIGQEKAKAAIREAVEAPFIHAELYKRFGRAAPKGVLLYGPPGNGKTMLAKAAATSLAKLHDKPAHSRGFISVKGPELQDKWYGGTPAKIRELFAEARAYKKDTGCPAIIFIDEAEALLMSRGQGGYYGSANDSCVQQFLTEMDGLESSAAIVMLATNIPHALDPAVLRDGRIDRRILVSGPTRSDAEGIFRKLLAPRPLRESADEIIEKACDELYSNRHGLYRVHLESGAPKTIALHHVTCFAQLAGIVERATSRAIARAINGGDEGLCALDMVAEVLNTYSESRAIIHMDEIVTFCEPFRTQVKGLERIREHETGLPLKVPALGLA